MWIQFHIQFCILLLHPLSWNSFQVIIEASTWVEYFNSQIHFHFNSESWFFNSHQTAFFSSTVVFACVSTFFWLVKWKKKTAELDYIELQRRHELNLDIFFFRFRRRVWSRFWRWFPCLMFLLFMLLYLNPPSSTRAVFFAGLNFESG